MTVPRNTSNGPRPRILIIDHAGLFTQAEKSALSERYQLLEFEDDVFQIKFAMLMSFQVVLLTVSRRDADLIKFLKILKSNFPRMLTLVLSRETHLHWESEGLRDFPREDVLAPYRFQELLGKVEEFVKANPTEASSEPPMNLVKIQHEQIRFSHPSIQRAVDHIQAHYNKDLPLGHVAALAGMSKFHFCRNFKKYTGLNFKKYINRTRLERALQLMHDEGRNITQIAHQVGFNDLTHFERVFKRYLGFTPVLYRNRLLREAKATVVGHRPLGRRMYERYPLRYPLSITGLDADDFLFSEESETLDVSFGGAFIRVSRKLKPKSVISLLVKPGALQKDRQEEKYDAEIIHQRFLPGPNPSWGTGVKFLRPFQLLEV